MQRTGEVVDTPLTCDRTSQKVAYPRASVFLSPHLLFAFKISDFPLGLAAASADKPVVAYFSAPWCAPCRLLSPRVRLVSCF